MDDSSRGLIESYYDTGLRPESPCNITREVYIESYYDTGLRPDSPCNITREVYIESYRIQGLGQRVPVISQERYI